MKTTQARPDILLIVLDTLRADRLSCYGYPRETTPNLDAFAEDSVLFERAISPAQWTIPAHASLFTGEYPSTHMTTQIYDKHSQEQATLAELLQREGYATVGFCNNPLLGVVENNLDRGFEEFYNYGGVFPDRPEISDTRSRQMGRILQKLGRLLNRINRPLQKALTTNNLLLKIVLNPRLVPLWQRHINIKGNTRQSLRDILGYLRTRQRKGRERPLFTFLNLMETHLPFGPGARFVRRFVPYYRNDREARDFMQAYNKENYGWMVPLREPLTALQDKVLNDMYAAEIAYEDHVLRHLYEYLNETETRENTMVIITSDHGEGMNNHNFVGHSLVAYDDLVRVPLVVRYPELYPAGKRISTPVSTRRIFHSALEAAGIFPTHNCATDAQGAPVDVRAWSLSNATNGQHSDPEQGLVFTEAYTPDTLITLMENNDPEAIDLFRCRFMRRAVYQHDYKLITVGDKPDELFNVIDDPGERHNLRDQAPDTVEELNDLLTTFIKAVEGRRPAKWRQERLNLESDEELANRLRGLGYME